MNFGCVKCGLCCKLIPSPEMMDHYPEEVRELFKGFPYKSTNGVCEMLSEDNTCKVYDNRPDVCNTEKLFHNQTMIKDKDHWYRMQVDTCNLLMDIDKSNYPRIPVNKALINEPDISCELKY